MTGATISLAPWSLEEVVGRDGKREWVLVDETGALIGLVRSSTADAAVVVRAPQLLHWIEQLMPLLESDKSNDWSEELGPLRPILQEIRREAVLGPLMTHDETPPSA